MLCRYVLYAKVRSIELRHELNSEGISKKALVKMLWFLRVTEMF